MYVIIIININIGSEDMEICAAFNTWKKNTFIIKRFNSEYEAIKNIITKGFDVFTRNKDGIRFILQALQKKCHIIQNISLILFIQKSTFIKFNPLRSIVHIFKFF